MIDSISSSSSSAHLNRREDLERPGLVMNPYRRTPNFARRIAAWTLPKVGIREVVRSALPTCMRLAPAIFGVPTYVAVKLSCDHLQGWPLATGFAVVWIALALPIAFTMSKPFLDWKKARIQRRALEWSRRMK